MENPPVGGDQNRASLLNGTSWPLALVALVFVIMRMYSRIRLTHNVWWDDWLILVTMTFTLSFTIIWTVYAEVGGCRHVYYLSLPQQEAAVRLNWISQPFAIMSIALGKVSVAFLILRLGPPDKLRRGLLYFSAFSLAISFAVQCILTFAQCNPPRALWRFNVVGKCWSPRVLSIFAMTVASYSALLDVGLPAIAISIIWKLQLSKRKKINLSLILSTGVFTCVCACIKASKLPALQSERADFTWDTIILFVWRTIEINVVIIAACVPTLRPVYLLVFRRSGAEVYSTKKRNYYLHSSTHNALQQKATSFDALTSDQANINKNEPISLVNGIMHTTDLDVTFDDDQSRKQFGFTVEDTCNRFDSEAAVGG